MNEQEQRDLAREILITLYDAWEHNTGISLNRFRGTEKSDKALFDTVLKRLADHYGYIRRSGNANSCEITAAGIIYAEDQGIIPQAKTERHRSVRAHVLAFLADLYERDASRANAHWRKISEGAPVEAFKILVDLSFLNELGYIEDVTSTLYQITDAGLHYYRGADYPDTI